MFLMSIPMLSDGVTSLKTTYKRCLIAVVIASVAMASASGGQKNARTASLAVETAASPSEESDGLNNQIRQEVTDLEYSEVVADDFVAMVSEWKTPRGLPVLTALQRMLDRSREAYKEGRISTSQLATMEEKAVAALGQSIQNAIPYRKDRFDLANIIEERRANCFGYSQLLCILGNALGLPVRTMNVTSEHVANIVGLSDGTMTAVDLIRSNGIMSERIITDSDYKGQGSRWKFTDENHITQEDKTIHILNQQELVSEIYFCRGTVRYLSGRGTEAIVQYDRSIELNPQCARAYNNRGSARLILSEHTEAIADFNKAIALSPTYVSAYHNRANAYLDSEQYGKAIADYTHAIQLNPRFGKAYLGRGFAHLALGDYSEAISDYTKAIAFDPGCGRTYYTRAIGYAHLGARQKAVQDMVRAVALDQTLKADVEKASAEFDLNLKLN
jgi:tetratricopeptide (TPR) repeat protein